MEHTQPKQKAGVGELRYIDIQINIKERFPSFNLEKAVCSHGLFLMAPNQWDPQSKTLLRPLRVAPCTSYLVRISCSSSLMIRVYGTAEVSSEEEREVVEQVKRMLRLSEREEKKVKEFQELHSQAKNMSFGRIFRSPTLFEDMVKAILFCNCQWPRTLSMAKALCDLQLELQSRPLKVSQDVLGGTTSKATRNGLESFTPRTPAIKEAQRQCKIQKVSGGVTDAANESIAAYARLNSFGFTNEIHHSENSLTNSDAPVHDDNVDGPIMENICIDERSGAFAEERMTDAALKMGNFPSPEELATLDETYLAKRCGLGYRAGRILKLAQDVVEGRIQLGQLEELSVEANLSNYNKLDEKLKEIKGYGPFTRGNVLMCLGFYNVVPSDSETIRHLKQVHKTTTTIQNVQGVVEEMYRRYEPYQFLAYWWELWNFYEERFGKFSEMSNSDYKLITASNMRNKKR